MGQHYIDVGQGNSSEALFELAICPAEMTAVMTYETCELRPASHS